jgi:parallel beta-helix repeat protein
MTPRRWLLLGLPLLAACDATGIVGAQSVADYAKRDSMEADSIRLLAARVRARLTPVANAVRLDSAAARLKRKPRVPTPAPVVGVLIALGMNADSAVQANPPGTTFTFAPGVHRRQDVRPKEGNIFRGPGATLDGENVTPHAFRGHNGSAWVNDVTIKHLTITRYNPPAQNGAIWAGDDRAPLTTSGWVLDSLNVHHNTQIGVRIGDRMRVLRSSITHNAGVNIGGVGKAVVVDGIESAYGNDGCVRDPGFEGGGSKFVKTDSLVVRNSFFHHNCGVGLWLDINNINALLEGNRVEDNVREGIAVEVSYKTIIRNNTVARNGWPTDPHRGNGWAWDAGIGVHASRDVEVYGNTLTENFNGVVAIQQPRGSAMGDVPPEFGPFEVWNLNVHDNTIYQRVAPASADGGWAGAAVQDDGSGTIFSRNNRWTNNTYYLGSNPFPFAWANGVRTAAQWRGYGQDVAGVFNP